MIDLFYEIFSVCHVVLQRLKKFNVCLKFFSDLQLQNFPWFRQALQLFIKLSPLSSAEYLQFIILIFTVRSEQQDQMTRNKRLRFAQSVTVTKGLVLCLHFSSGTFIINFRGPCKLTGNYKRKILFFFKTYFRKILNFE